MKPHFHKVPVKLENSFSVRHDIKPNFGSVWHYHPELELHYVIKGEGVQFIGDRIRNFSTGEMILLGQNLPHTWRCSERYFQENSCCYVEALVLQFLPTCLGKEFLDLPEAFMIPRLFEKAKQGLIISGEKKRRVSVLLEKALNASHLDRLILLLSILKILATDIEEAETITSSYVISNSNATEMARLDRIYSYAMDHYKKEISLEEIASVVSMSATSFCRYFKLMTNKTFSTFLTEIRISHVCRALIENRLPTEVICFECGFNNISNFYRHFKKVTGLTPYEYKLQYLSNSRLRIPSLAVA